MKVRSDSEYKLFDSGLVCKRKDYAYGAGSGLIICSKKGQRSMSCVISMMQTKATH